ncbi:MAG: outer membrane beta-barrel protein [Paracoccaceae bacterium]
MKIFNAFAALALTASPALAGNMNPPPEQPVVMSPAPAPVMTGWDWTGGYVGAQLGYGNINTKNTNADGNGVLGGIHAGYNYDFGRFVLGGEVDIDGTNIDLNGDNVNSISRLKLRGGYDLGRTLIYGTTGVAYADVKNAGNDNGYLVGVGAEHMVTDRFGVGGELLYHRFDNFNGTGNDIEATTFAARATFHF